jgi:hypothetical protein
VSTPPARRPACLQVVLCGAQLRAYEQYLMVRGMVLAALPDDAQDPDDLPTYTVVPYDPRAQALP